MNSQYLTKTELAKRWSQNLVDFYFPNPTLEKANPRHKRGAPMQLYDIKKVKYIESLEVFREEWAKILERRLARIKKKQGENC